MSCVTCTIVTRPLLVAVDPQQEVLELGARQCVDGRERLVEEQNLRTRRRAHARSPRAAASRLRAARGTSARRRASPTSSSTASARAIRLRSRSARATERKRHVPDARSATGRASGCSPGRRARTRAVAAGRAGRRRAPRPALAGIRPQSRRSNVVLPQPDAADDGEQLSLFDVEVTRSRRPARRPSTASRDPRRGWPAAPARAACVGCIGSAEPRHRLLRSATRGTRRSPTRNSRFSAYPSRPRNSMPPYSSGTLNCDCWNRM